MRDYEVEIPSDKQAIHSSLTAGRLYNQGLEDGRRAR